MFAPLFRVDMCHFLSGQDEMCFMGFVDSCVVVVIIGVVVVVVVVVVVAVVVVVVTTGQSSTTIQSSGKNSSQQVSADGNKNPFCVHASGCSPLFVHVLAPPVNVDMCHFASGHELSRL